MVSQLVELKPPTLRTKTPSNTSDPKRSIGFEVRKSYPSAFRRRPARSARAQSMAAAFGPKTDARHERLPGVPPLRVHRARHTSHARLGGELREAALCQARAGFDRDGYTR